MTIETLRFGSIDVDPSGVITLDDGLIGFPDAQRYCLLEHRPGGSVKWLQSLEHPELAFLVINPHEFFADYEVELADDTARDMHLTEPGDAAVLALVSVQEERRLTANLLGPVVINTRTGRGRQVVLDSDHYTTRHPLGESKPAACACSAA